MASTVFQPLDKPSIIEALEASNTGGTLGRLEAGMELRPSADNKSIRATRIVNAWFAHRDTDELIFRFLDSTYVQAENADRLRGSREFRQLKRTLDRRGVHFSESGFFVDNKRPPEPIPSSTSDVPPPWSAPTTANPSSESVVIWTQPARQTPTPEKVMTRDPKKVFLVRGRDTRPFVALEQFLHFAGLTVISWQDAAHLTGKPQPHTYEIVKAGIDSAGATIVIWSADDEAQLKADLGKGPGDPATQVMGQARQNVIFEAGMAYATSPNNTIFVSSDSSLRMPSDIEGFNWVTLDGSWGSREDLINRLKYTEAEPLLHGTNLNDRLAGPFKVE
ncbi:TIR domain-containing protein [Leifsonia shinshuensis]|uniref:TIR domain-containing protein n=1 Tax=Leifsonia shinshuensis TaxID=150026 RepID=UPI002861B20F|nr:TIR domain-containing protein [Leifsonia shinshuensis]MDR6971259.1 putative nucleotide-binding protein/putative nucleic acid-binding Zn ribbon protein [Leifsonia shinshuensis]